MRVWVNGRVLDDAASPSIRVDDHGFIVGDGVFEALKVIGGQPFAMTLHLDRLTRSAQGLGIPDPDHGQIRDAVAQVLAGPTAALAKLRITWTAGPSPVGSGRGPSTPTLVVIASALDPAPPTTKVITVPWPRNERGVLAGVKTTSYAENVIALARAHQAGASEAIFANTAGNLCEGTGTNVFYVLDGELRTPSLASGCLAGVTRGLILKWYGAREVDEPISVIEGASEVFVASTTRDVQAVEQWNETTFPAPGVMTQQVVQRWRERHAELLGDEALDEAVEVEVD